MGGGYVAFMVAKPGAGAPPTAPVKSRTAEAIAYNNALQAYSDALDSYLSNGVSMQHLAFDGVTLIPKTKGTGNWRHEMRDVTSMELAPANRSDFLFQAPSTPGAYTIYGVGINHKNLSVGTGYDESTLLGDGGPAPIVFATLNVTASTIPAFNISSIVLPDVPDNLLPVDTADLAGPAGGHRTRSLVYSGTGNGGYSCATGTKSTENGKNSMAIGRYNTTGDVGGEQKIIGGMKFDAVRPVQTMLLGSSEEWVLDNWSVVQGGMVDHPFHMHQNPFWVIAVFEPILDTNGHPTGWGPNLVEYPRWQDVVPIPRNGGRVIFRSRFPDYHGSYVNHCHLLQHEDWGMMQTVEVVTRSAAANNDWTETPYDPISNPNGPYQPTIRVTFEDMSRACQIFQSVPETAGGTPLPLSFCQP
jgi:FtsP/CotA-like multicopper oxidase with cupredoxin domain